MEKKGCKNYVQAINNEGKQKVQSEVLRNSKMLIVGSDKWTITGSSIDHGKETWKAQRKCKIWSIMELIVFGVGFDRDG